MDGGAYGAGRAGAPFNPVQFIRKPQVIVRLLALLFAIIVFGCLASRGYSRLNPECQFGGQACSYGIVIGVLAFLICIVFLVLDALFEQLSSVQHRKYAVLADIGLSGLWCFLWFVGFCYLADKWRTSTNKDPSGYGADDNRSAIAFSFFSTIAWGVLTALAVLKYRKGVTEEFGASDDVPRPDIAQSSNPYASFGGDGEQSYQQTPYAGGGGFDASQAPPSEYQQPTY